MDAAWKLVEDALDAWPDRPDLLHARGALQRRQGANVDAMATYERLLEREPQDELAASILTLLLREQARSADETDRFRLLERAMALSDGAPSVAVPYCLAAAQSGHPQLAADAYARLPADLQAQPALRRAAADSYRALGQPDNAVPLYTDLLAAEPQNDELAALLAEVASSGEPDAARARLAALTPRFPGCIPLELAAARLQPLDPNPWRALQQLSRILDIDPTDVGTAAHRIELLSNAGCHTLALTTLKAYGDRMPADLVARVLERAALQREQWAALEPADASTPATNLLALAYGDVSDEPRPGSMTIATFIAHLEYLVGNGYHPLSDREVAAAARRGQPLPERAVMITVLRGHASFASDVLPILEQYRIPAMLAIATDEIGGTDFLTWAQVRALSRNPLVTLASMTHALGARIPCNPQGRLGLASISRRYDDARAAYETPAEYRDRVGADLRLSANRMLSGAGTPVDLLVWPEGEFNAVTLAEAGSMDFTRMYAPRRQAAAPLPPGMRALLPVDGDLPVKALAALLRRGEPTPPPPQPSFAMPIDLRDVAAATSPGDQRDALANMIKRVAAAKADTVYLTSTLDADEDGLADAAFFANRVLPVQADILDQAAGLLRDRGVRVFIMMPVLGIRPPGRSPDSRLLVAEYRAGRPQTSASGSRRLSPFNPKSCDLIEQVYADLAANVAFDGVAFAPDAYLSPTEDFSTPAAAVLRSRLTFLERDPNRFSADQRQRWNAIKTATLEDLLSGLRTSIAALHPSALFIRCLQGPVVATPNGGGLFAQDYQVALRHNDLVWINATPEAYQPGDPDRWLADLADDVNANPADAARTVLAVGLWDPQSRTWISDAEWSRRISLLIDHHIAHIAYHPDGEPHREGPQPRRAATAASAIRKAD